MKVNWQLSEHRERPVLFRDDFSAGADRPRNPQIRIGRIQSPIVGGRKDCVYFVANLSIRNQRAEAVGETCRNEKLLTAIGAELDRKMLAVTARRPTQIDDDVAYFAANNSNELCLLKRRCLEV